MGVDMRTNGFISIPLSSRASNKSPSPGHQYAHIQSNDGRPDSTSVPWIPDPHFPGTMRPAYSVSSFATTHTGNSFTQQYNSSRGSLHTSGDTESLKPALGRRNSPGIDLKPTRSTPSPRSHCGKVALVIGGFTCIIFLGVLLPVYFWLTAKSPEADTNEVAPIDEHTPTPPLVFTTGGDGSNVTMSNGSTFIYRNPFNGYWVQNLEDPFNLDARPNDWTPPLNTSWRFGRDRILGVNLGGLFVLEPFITPEIFQRYPEAVDEYTLTALMREAEANSTEGGLRDLEEHYATFITEEDIAAIAGSGLNWLRVPLGFWAIETYETEPFLERTSWMYFLQIVEWARKYGLRIYLDLHAVPGGQNAMNHSAKLRQISFLAGNMGIANAQRTLYYLRVITEFISQPQYRDVIPILGLVNEPLSRAIGIEALTSFYLEAYTMIRKITGFGEGNGPYIAIGDGLRPSLDWEGLLPNADRVIMDIHPYVAFDPGFNTASLTEAADDGRLGGIWPSMACSRWGGLMNRSRAAIGLTIGGEFSGALNDCGLFIREVGMDSDHPQCSLYNDWENWNVNLKEGLESFILASMDSLTDFFFWTWKIGPSADGKVAAPFWSYKLGLEQGWIPKDPRKSVGKCHSLGVTKDTFDGNYQPWQTGALSDPTPTIPADYIASNPWPPATLSHADVPVSLMPTYTSTATVITLPVPMFTGAPPEATAGLDGWFNDDDTGGGASPIEGCFYPDPYAAVFETLPTAPCA